MAGTDDLVTLIIINLYMKLYGGNIITKVEKDRSVCLSVIIHFCRGILTVRGQVSESAQAHSADRPTTYFFYKKIS